MTKVNLEFGGFDLEKVLEKKDDLASDAESAAIENKVVSKKPSRPRNNPKPYQSPVMQMPKGIPEHGFSSNRNRIIHYASVTVALGIFAYSIIKYVYDKW